MNTSAHDLIGIIGALIFTAPTVSYIASILQNKTRPSAASWLGWTALMSIVSAAQLAKGATISVLIPVMSAFSDGIVFIVMLFVLKRFHFSYLDYACFLGGAIAISAWVFTKEPLNALLLSLTADLIVAVPTIVKTLADPSSEAPLPWLLFAVGALISGAASTSYDVANIAAPIYFTVLCSLIGLLALRARFGKNV